MKQKILWLFDGILLLAVPLAAPLANWMIGALPPCFFATRGITCPSCGATRCVRALFSCQLGEAFAFHPFLFLLIFYLALTLVLANLGILLRRSRIEKISLAMVSPAAILVLSVIYTVFGVVRAIVLLP